jgi:uncharacterized protein
MVVPGKSPITPLYLHGSGANTSRDAKHLNRFHEMGLSVFSFDYQKYERSREFPSEFAVYADA